MSVKSCSLARIIHDANEMSANCVVIKDDGLVKSPSTRPARGAQINDSHRKSLICEERENDAFPFPWSRKSRQDFLRPYQGWDCQCVGSHDMFKLYLRPYQVQVWERQFYMRSLWGSTAQNRMAVLDSECRVQCVVCRVQRLRACKIRFIWGMNTCEQNHISRNRLQSPQNPKELNLFHHPFVTVRM